MARRRFRRKDLKRPDEFVSRGRQVLDWTGQNARLLGWSGCGAAAVVLLILGFVSMRGARARQANEDLSHALADFRDGRYATAATQLTDVAHRWQGTPAGRIAGLYAANANLKSDNFETATVVLQDVLDKDNWPPYLRQQALVVLGYALEHKADMATAASRYAEASGLDGPYAAAALLGEARCREQLGEKDRARDLYQRFTHDFPDAPQSDLVSGKLDQLPATSGDRGGAGAQGS